MTLSRTRALAAVAAAALALPLAAVRAQDIKVDLGKETVGKTPVVFEPMMGMWVVAQDGPDKVIKVDGAAFKATLDTPTRLALENARKMYGTTNEELMDNAKQFTTFPIAVLKTVDNFTNGTISMKFKTISGDADRCSGILFNVKPNGDWLSARYNDTEHNVVLWEFHNGIRRPMIRPRDGTLLNTPEDRAKWHELKLTVNGADLQVDLDGTTQLKYTLGSEPAPGRNGAPPNADLIPANNPVIRPPVSGKVGLWSKTDSTSLFKDYVVVKK
ncbi:MAG TPA: hypothetical protein VLT86_19070 [Vicinamibacterales bacterium]|nr:hypothetical protein [Vicinamibacterales bacterium]